MNGKQRRFAVVTDSSADLPPALRAKHGISVVPLTVTFGAEEFADGVDLSPQEFWQRVARGGDLPRTTQPGPADFARVYQRLYADGMGILSVHLSGEMSGTVQSARLAAGDFPAGAIRVVDSRSASMGVGFLALAAARMAEEGVALEEAEAAVRALAGKLEIFFTVDSLEWLRRNGRIGRAKAFLGTLLNVKPVLTIEDGVVSPVEQVRSRERSLHRLVELAREAAAGRTVDVAVVHGDCPEDGERVMAELVASVDARERVVVWLGSTIGAHTGPGTLGIVMLPV